MRIVLVLLGLILSLPAIAKPRAVRHPSGPTFSKEVVRILRQHCQTCHREGDIAPFSLTTYEEVKSRASLIQFMTSTRKMPPWKPSEGCGEFLHERRLTQGEIDTIGAWVQNGAPEGDPSDLPPSLEPHSEWLLGQPDLVVKSSEPFTPAPVGDTYRCFVVPTNFTTSKYVRAFDTRPGDRRTVHHLFASFDTTGAAEALDEADPGPGYRCFGGPDFHIFAILGVWMPGSRPYELPEGLGLELPPNARIVLQVHYHAHHDAPNADQTEFGLYFTEDTPRAVMRFFPIVNRSFTIPPGDPNYNVTANLFGLPVTPFSAKLWLIVPHMHLLGRKMKVEMRSRTGETRCLIDIQDWDFNWQGIYFYRDPIDIPAGSRLFATAYYDNSESNPRNPNHPPRPVSWGWESTDEMCLAVVGVTVESTR